MSPSRGEYSSESILHLPPGGVLGQVSCFLAHFTPPSPVLTPFSQNLMDYSLALSYFWAQC